MLEQPMAVSFDGAPASAVEEFTHEMGVNFQFGDFTTTITTCIIVLFATAAIFYTLSILNLSRKRK